MLSIILSIMCLFIIISVVYICIVFFVSKKKEMSYITVKNNKKYKNKNYKNKKK